MKTQSFSDLKNRCLQLPEKIPYLKILVLFGSRARGDTHAKSDWDFAVVYDNEIRKNHIENNAFAWF
ncbi:nucleotidyltransferase domain-containing protein [Okeania sp. SIO2C2]|uniref:nucleotidyltransferase domain-containing protein n=1 Tax=Okeania sp. SIO2C2 TaxID=2607787 RepID=UPI002579DC11|nr:nucleotidyltransferase domain-containing protein [Okeania sp. SIO2C2]